MTYLERLAAENPIRCSPKGVYGLAQLVELRRARRKPASVDIDLVRHIDRSLPVFTSPWTPTKLNLVISVDADLSRVDFRPLVGLEVYMLGGSVGGEPFRKLANKVWEIPTKLLVVTMEGKSGSVLYVRRGETVDRAQL